MGRRNPSLKAIYLDDMSSNITVTKNIVYGSGWYGIQYHGGDHITVNNNIFDISRARQVGFYQTAGGGDINTNTFTR
jgi:parallel beta-helix repeat protein